MSSLPQAPHFNIVKSRLTFIKGRGTLVPMDDCFQTENDGDRQERHPLLSLTAEERELVLRLVLASGSLKELARAYQVSYPTIRARLDRLIARLRHIIEGMPVDPMDELLADLVERGEMTYSAARSIKNLHRKTRKEGV